MLKDGHVDDSRAAGDRHGVGRESRRAATPFDVHPALRRTGRRASRRSLELPRQTVYANLDGERRAASAARRHRLLRAARCPTRELKREVDALAGFLQQRCGVKRGDRVLLYVQNSPQFVIAYYAILRADAVVVPVNPMNRTEELRHYVEDSDARVAIVGAGRAARRSSRSRPGARAARRVLRLSRRGDRPAACRISSARRTGRRSGIALEGSAARRTRARQPHLARPDDLAVMPYTSGTTGKPKGCMHTHASVQATTVPYLHWRGAQEKSVVLSRAADVPRHRHAGRHERADPPRRPRWWCCRAGTATAPALQIQRARVTNWSAITTMMVDFLSNPKLGKYDLVSLRVLGGGGAAMPEALARKLEEVIGLPFVEGYGLSETMAPTHINPPHRPKRQCAGIPFFNTDARVARPGKLQGAVGRTRSARSSSTARRCSAATGSSPRRARRRSSSTTASASSAPATSATTTRKATSSSPTG